MRPLEGSTVLEVAEGAAAPLCGRLLAELGARVIKVEPPEGDVSRRYGPFPASGPDPELSGLFIYQNAGKESVVLDWRSGDAADALLDLACYADILIDDIRPIDAARAGIDFEALRGRNPGLVRVSLTPFGQTGPCADWDAEHLTLSHMGGEGYVLPGANSDPENKLADRPPIQIGGLIADAHSGYIAAIAAMGAVAVRDHSGVGQHVDISKWEAELIPNRGVLDEWNNQGEETGAPQRHAGDDAPPSLQGRPALHHVPPRRTVRAAGQSARQGGVEDRPPPRHSRAPRPEPRGLHPDGHGMAGRQAG